MQKQRIWVLMHLVNTHNLILSSFLVTKSAVRLIFLLFFMWPLANTHFLQSLLLCCTKAFAVVKQDP